MYIESLKKFVKYFGAGRKLKLAVFFVMSLIAGVLEFFGVALIYPFVIMLISPEKTYDMFQFIPHFNGYPVKHLALALGGAALLLFVVKNLYMVLFVFVQNKFVQKWTQYINNKFMLFYLYAPYERILKISNTDKLYVITTLSAQATGGFLIRIMTLVTNLSIVLLILGLILLKFPIAGFVSLAFIFVSLVSQNLIFKGKTRELGMKLQETSKKVNAINYTIINNIKDIKIFSCEKSFYDLFGGTGAEYTDENAMQAFYGAIPPYFVETLIVITLLLLGAIITVQNINNSSIMVASFAMIVASIFRIAPALNRIQSSLLNLPAGLNFVNGLNMAYERFGLDNFLCETSQNVKPIAFHDKIILHDVSFGYEPEKPVLKNISFEINKGDFVGIIGLSGAGKSTLADIITGLLIPSSGELIVDNMRLTPQIHASFRKNIGYVQQDLNVLEKSFRENVAWGVSPELIDDKRVEFLLNQVQLSDVVANYPNGIYSIPFVGENGLSRGQKQRLAIARALYRNPDILIFDEATSALDVKVEHEITNMLLNVCHEKTIIAIAHRLSTLKACNKLIYLKDGCLIDIGTFEDLSEKYPDFAELVRLSSLSK